MVIREVLILALSTGAAAGLMVSQAAAANWEKFEVPYVWQSGRWKEGLERYVDKPICVTVEKDEYGDDFHFTLITSTAGWHALVLQYRNGNETSNAGNTAYGLTGPPWKRRLLLMILPATIDLFADGERVMSLQAKLGRSEKTEYDSIYDNWGAEITPDQLAHLISLLTAHMQLTDKAYISEGDQMVHSNWATIQYSARSLDFELSGVGLAEVLRMEPECLRRATEILSPEPGQP